MVEMSSHLYSYAARTDHAFVQYDRLHTHNIKNSFLLHLKLLESEIMVKSYSQKYQIPVNFDRHCNCRCVRQMRVGCRFEIPSSDELIATITEDIDWTAQ